MDTILNRIASSRKAQFWLFFTLLGLLSVTMVYLYSPFCPGHDSYFHFRRLEALMDGLKVSPFLIYTDYSAIEGYGYFTKGFYPDFVLIPFAFIGNLTNLDFAYQFMLFTMTVFCGIFTYLSVNRIYKNTYAAAISALLYTFAIYRLLDIYHRGALGEALSFTFIPIVFWGIYEIVKGDYRKWYIITIGFSLLIFTHAIATLLMFVTTVIFLLIYYKSFVREPKRILYLILAGVFTIPIVSCFLFPMIEQLLSNTFYYQTNPLMKIKDNLLGTYSIFWGLFSGIVYPERKFIPGTGLLLTCAIVLRLFVYGKSIRLRSADICVLIGLIYIFASSYLFPWQLFPFNKLFIIQIPWRLYEFSSFLFAVASGYYLSLILQSNTRRFMAGGVLVICTIVMMSNDAKMYHDVRCSLGIVRESTFENNYHLIGLEYLPVKVPSIEYLAERGDDIISMQPGTSITDFGRNKEVVSFGVNTNENEILELPLIYYKGYTAKLNNNSLVVSESNNGLVQVSINESGYVEVYYEGTILQKISWLITLFSILSLCAYIFMLKRNKVNPIEK
ncbi:hypothetical protein JGH11_02230 [Dysgonomonas sp. Marseille-P4677]|nr:hypothetical protein [Dysgonomonas sp. Marseille-P4677]